MASSLRNSRLVQRLAEITVASEANLKYAGLPKGTVRGRVVDVEDPKRRGRVRVIFDSMNHEDIPQVEGTGEEFIGPRVGQGLEKSHWIDTSPAFVGWQPKGLIGKRVNIALSNGQYQYAILGDVMNDPEVLTPEAAGELEPPNNSNMTRLPCYTPDEIPPAAKENLGCVIVELGGPQGDDWLMVCLSRGGSFCWVRMIDRLHFHTGQLPDSRGDRENRTYDDVIQTTGIGGGPAPTEGLD
jgi:hypothetical protein